MTEDERQISKMEKILLEMFTVEQLEKITEEANRAIRESLKQ